MSQNYFDKLVNRIGEEANSLARVIIPSRITNEEINTWVDDLSPPNFKKLNIKYPNVELFLA